VTDIMGEISAASNEQSMGVAQVGEAVTQMDQATQQNAALVEEMAAAASSLKSQAQDLVQVVAAFKVDGGTSRSLPASLPAKRAPMIHKPASAPMRKPAPARSLASTTAKHAAPAAALPKPVATAKTKPTPAGGDDDWETF
jgi:Skp family chaperone for outer membrane proteins